jgi:hypothetical protein
MQRKPEFKTVNIKLEVSLMENDHEKFIEKLEKEGVVEALTQDDLLVVLKKII